MANNLQTDILLFNIQWSEPHSSKGSSGVDWPLASLKRERVTRSLCAKLSCGCVLVSVSVFSISPLFSLTLSLSLSLFLFLSHSLSLSLSSDDAADSLSLCSPVIRADVIPFGGCLYVNCNVNWEGLKLYGGLSE